MSIKALPTADAIAKLIASLVGKNATAKAGPALTRRPRAAWTACAWMTRPA